VSRAASSVQGGGWWRAIRRQRLLHATNSPARGCQIVAERVKVRNFEGQMGQHAARSPHMAFRSTMTTSGLGHGSGRVQSTLVENGPPCLMCMNTGLRIVGLWLPNGGALHLRVREIRRPGHAPYSSGWRFGGSAASTGGGISCGGDSKSECHSLVLGFASDPASTTGERCVLATSECVGGGNVDK